jgi:ATP-binding cassette subfamily A (ABC1) protein 3
VRQFSFKTALILLFNFNQRINESEGTVEESEAANNSNNGHLNITFTGDDQTKNLTSSQNANINLPKDEIDADFGLWTGSKSEDLVQGDALYVQQFYALIVKRFINSLRNKSLIISQLVIPIFILLVNLFYVKYAPIKAEDSPQLAMSITSYGKTYVPLLLQPGSGSPDLANDLMNAYAAQFKALPDVTAYSLADNSTSLICPEERSDMDNFLGCVGSVNLFSYLDEYMVATTYEQTGDRKVNVTAFFNNQPFHAVPLSINLVTNGFLKYFSGSESASIRVINHPLPRNIQEQADDLTTKNQTGFQVGSGLTFGFSFLIASFVIFLIKERTSDAKHLQYMSGCNSYVFWFAAFTWDILNYLIPTVSVVILLFVSRFLIEFFYIFVQLNLNTRF